MGANWSEGGLLGQQSYTGPKPPLWEISPLSPEA
jgi:hypothetical protein